MKQLTGLIVLAGLISGAGLLGSPAWARCPRACSASITAANRTCTAACVPPGPGRECRSACKAERRAEKVTCRAAVMPTPPGCGLDMADLYVAAFGALNGDGSASKPYRRITDAVARARAERAFGALPPEEEIRIHVAPGTYVGSYNPAQLKAHAEYEVLPIILNVPTFAVLGSTVLVRDDRGLPTAADSASEAILEPDKSWVRTSICFSSRAPPMVRWGMGSRSMASFSMERRRLPRCRRLHRPGVGLPIHNNLVERSAFGVMTRLASGTIEGNLLADNLELGSVVTGGSLAQPATVLIHANRATRNAAHGFGTRGRWLDQAPHRSRAKYTGPA